MAMMSLCEKLVNIFNTPYNIIIVKDSIKQINYPSDCTISMAHT